MLQPADRSAQSVNCAVLLDDHSFVLSSTDYVAQSVNDNDWIVQCFMSPPTQYRLYGRQFLQVKRPNQQYQSTDWLSMVLRLRQHNIGYTAKVLKEHSTQITPKIH